MVELNLFILLKIIFINLGDLLLKKDFGLILAYSFPVFSLPFLFYLVVYLISRILTCLCVLIAVAFYTLLERKILGYVQLRKGPNKPSIWGIAQPLADAVKLFVKEKVIPYGRNQFIFIFAPVLGLVLGLSL